MANGDRGLARNGLAWLLALGFMLTGCDGLLDIQDLSYRGASHDAAAPADAQADASARTDARATKDGAHDAPATTDGPATLACGAGTSVCGSECVDEQTDPDNCGGCGVACTMGLVCSVGACVVTCASELTQCRAAGDGGPTLCIDTQHDSSNCGGCHNVCASGEVCNAGACDVSCPGAEVNCGGVCIDPTTSNQFCGATGACGVADAGTPGTICSAGQICSGGECGATCHTGELNCAGTCVDPLTSNQFCGASGSCSGASAGATCATGHVCAGGTCAVSCLSNELNCDGTCVNPETSNQFCGATGGCAGTSAGAVCPSGQVCAAGTCALSCPSGELNCGGTCVNPETSNQFCGASGSCTGASVGAACPAGDVCLSGACSATCGGGNIACGGACVNPQASNQYCGASGSCTGTSAGAVCGLQQACVEGSCATLQVSCSGATPPAPTFASVWPATTGWLGSNGHPISLTINNPGITATFECRTGPVATVGSMNFTECDGGGGTGLTYAPAPDVNGEHRTDVRIRTSSTCVGATTSYSFYVHSSLNSVPACAAPATDAQIFAAAAQYVSVGATFGAGVQLANPFIQIPFSGRPASILSLRHAFTMNAAGTLLSMRRALQSAKSGSCGNPFRMGSDDGGNPVRTYPNCAVVVFNASGAGVCLTGSAGNLTSSGVFSTLNARVAGPAPRASFFANRPFSQKSTTIQNDPHWLYLPE